MTIDKNAGAISDIFYQNYAFNNIYQVEIFLPNGSIEERSSNGLDTESINSYLKFHSPNVSFAGDSLNLVRNDITKKFTIDNQSYKRSDTLSITWREADDWKVKRYHENWIKLFYDKEKDQYQSHESNAGLYRNIRVYLGNNKAILFTGAIPSTVPSLNLSWSNSPSIITHSVNYYIEDWNWETVEGGIF